MPYCGRFFLCREEGWEPSSLYQVERPEQYHCPLPTPSTFGAHSIRTTPWSHDLHQAGILERVQSH